MDLGKDTEMEKLAAEIAEMTGTTKEVAGARGIAGEEGEVGDETRPQGEAAERPEGV